MSRLTTLELEARRERHENECRDVALAALGLRRVAGRWQVRRGRARTQWVDLDPLPITEGAS